jgi:hypothetical protein
MKTQGEYAEECAKLSINTELALDTLTYVTKYLEELRQNIANGDMWSAAWSGARVERWAKVLKSELEGKPNMYSDEETHASLAKWGVKL